MSFLPKDHKEPVSKGNYTKLTEGTHKLRILSSAIIGYEGWSEEDGKRAPVRYRMGEQPPFGPDGKEPKYFWAFTVWNYAQERVQIMQVTQKTIRTAIEAYVENEAWGDPKNYDIVITRKGTTRDDTEYNVVANPATDLTDTIKGAMVTTPVNLDALFDGKDPFEKKKEESLDDF